MKGAIYLDIKEKKEYLEGYRRTQARIVAMAMEIEKWQTIGEKVNNDIGTGGGGNYKTSKVEKSAVNVADIIADIQLEINGAKQQREAIKNTIDNGCKFLRHQEILTMRYINGMSVWKIAKVLHKEEKTVSNMINAALKELNI